MQQVLRLRVLRLRAPRDGERTLLVREGTRLCRVVDKPELWRVADDARQPAAPPRPPPGRWWGILAVAASLPFARLSGQFFLFTNGLFFQLEGNY